MSNDSNHQGEGTPQLPRNHIELTRLRRNREAAHAIFLRACDAYAKEAYAELATGMNARDPVAIAEVRKTLRDTVDQLAGQVKCCQENIDIDGDIDHLRSAVSSLDVCSSGLAMLVATVPLETLFDESIDGEAEAR